MNMIDSSKLVVNTDGLCISTNYPIAKMSDRDFDGDDRWRLTTTTDAAPLTFEDLKEFQDRINEKLLVYAPYKKTDCKDPEFFIDKKAKLYFNKDSVVIKLGSGYTRVYHRKDGVEASKDKFGSFCLALSEFYFSNRAKYERKSWPLPVNTEHFYETTRVMFSDGTTTEVKMTESDPSICRNETGFAICVCKKLLGSTSTIIAAMNAMLYNANEKAISRKFFLEAIKKDKADSRKKMEKLKKAQFNAMVDKEMEKILARREAERRVAAMDAAEKKKAQKTSKPRRKTAKSQE